MAEDGCRVCPDPLPKHHRRTIFGPTFNVGPQLTEVLGYVPHPDDKLWILLHKTKQIVEDRFRSSTPY